MTKKIVVCTLFLGISLACRTYDISRANLIPKEIPGNTWRCTLRPAYAETIDHIAVREAIRETNFIEIVPFTGRDSNRNCDIEIIQIIPIDTQPMLGVSILTLGLIPIYDPFADRQIIRFSVFQNNVTTLMQEYRIGYSVTYWLPLFWSTFTNQSKATEATREIIQDFFYRKTN